MNAGVVTGTACTRDHFTGDEGHFTGAQAKVCTQVGNHFVYAAGPGRATGVAFTLMENNTFNNTIFLGFARQVEHPGVTPSTTRY